MAPKLSLALFVFSISLIVLNINAESEHGPQKLLEYSEVLNRLQAFTGLLEDKFVRQNLDKNSTPEAVIKPNAFPAAADYKFIRMLALHANYQFDDDKLPFDQWLERIIEKNTTKVDEDQTSLQQRKENNARTVYKFVAIMCALIQDTVIYDNKFYEYMPIFERMEKIKKSIEENAADLAKVWKEKWQDYNVEKKTLNRQNGQSIWGLLAMKDDMLTEKYMNSKPDLSKDNTEKFSVAFYRKFRISAFLDDYLKQKLLEKNPNDFMQKAMSSINDPAVNKILGHLAKSSGYKKWHDEFVASGPKWFNLKFLNKDSEQKSKLVYKGMGKVITMLGAMYKLVWEAPFNMQRQSMKDYYLVYEQLRHVEEHYKKADPMGWERKVKEAKLMLEHEFIRQNAEEESGKDMVTDYGRGGSNWSWVWASDNFIENSLARTKKQMSSSSSHP